MMSHEESDGLIESELENWDRSRVGITTLCVIGLSIGGGIFIYEWSDIDNYTKLPMLKIGLGASWESSVLTTCTEGVGIKKFEKVVEIPKFELTLSIYLSMIFELMCSYETLWI